ncbi:uroporphyrinogen-III C-methyltransferase [Parvibium lacunae]|uniref:Heme biosynthesis operon protein HemX n=1 Tax=Parvibium lacunae TaxID=1888893 RepID=A0A368L454_9BURK|nr:uroporphyrinogen-III C-methyltransferase [Parvibium lacunae]RCS58361.1 hypothetical protein DU000_05955 [Parvibium lacunae]
MTSTDSPHSTTPSAATSAPPDSERAPDAAPTAPYIIRQTRGLPFSAAWRRRLLFGVLALLVGASIYQINALDHVQRELARRVQDNDAVSQEARLFAKEASNAVRDIQNRIAQMEERIATSQSQQLALEQLYRDLSQSRDDWLLTEIEQTLQVANQQLQLSGNVAGALAALQTADTRLARVDRPQYLPLRKALAQDMDRLKLLPQLDLAGMAVKLDNLVLAVDALPLLADSQHDVAEPVVGKTSNSAAALAAPPAPVPETEITFKGEAPWQIAWLRLQHTVITAAAKIWAQLRELIRVREVDTPEALLLSPNQAYFVRENFKLRLLNARLALMSRNEEAFRADIRQAQDWLQRYFDGQQKSVTLVAQQLQGLGSTTLSIQLPTLSDSLTTVRKLGSNVTPAKVQK